MKSRQKAAAVMLLATLASATACAKTSSVTDSKELLSYTVSIDGEKRDANISKEEISKLTENMGEFLKAMVSADYQNPSGDAEYEYYTKAVAKANRDSGEPERVVASMKKYELVQEFLEYDTQSIEYYRKNGQEVLEVTTLYKAVYTHSTEEYTAAVGIEPNVTYKRTATVTLSKEDDDWKVTSFTATQREVA